MASYCLYVEPKTKVISQKLKTQWWFPEAGQGVLEGGTGKGWLMYTKLQYARTKKFWGSIAQYSEY